MSPIKKSIDKQKINSEQKFCAQNGYKESK